MSNEHAEALARDWERKAKEDPLYTILTRSDKRDGRWDPAEFFRTGEVFQEELIGRLKCAGLIREGAERALDFGCGVGRLTRPLAKHFQQAHGCDVSPTMVRLAQEMPGTPGNCVFRRSSPDGALPHKSDFFDFTMAYAVFGHPPSKIAARVLEEMLRVTKPGGAVVFDSPMLFMFHTPQGAIVLDGIAHPGGTQETTSVTGRRTGMGGAFVGVVKAGEAPLYTWPLGEAERVVKENGGCVLFREMDPANFMKPPEGCWAINVLWTIRKMGNGESGT